MKEDRIITAVGVLTVIMGLLMMSTGRYIMGGIVLLLAFGIFWNRGSGSRNDRIIYEKEIKTDIGIFELYEKLKDVDTPLGKPWIATHKGFPGSSIVFGPGQFKDCVVISRKNSIIDVKHITKLDNIIRTEADEYRFEGLLDTAEAEVTPERYSLFAGFKLASVMLVKHLAGLIQDLADGKNVKIPDELDLFKFYYHNSSDGHFRDSDGAEVMTVAGSYRPFEAKVFDAEGEELASVEARSFNKKGNVNDSAGFELLANGERFGEIRRFRDRSGEGFVCDTEEGEFRAVIFPACLRANVACNYMIEHDGKLKAVIGGSPNLLFEAEGRCRNDVILSYDDDYLVLYAILETFILTLNSGFLK